MTRIILLLWVLGGHVCFLSAQDSIVIRGEVQDRLQNIKVPNAAVKLEVDGKIYHSTTGYHGNFTMNVPYDEQYSVESSHFLYESTTLLLPVSPHQDTLHIVFEMKRIGMMPEVVIEQRGVPIKIFGDSLLSVSDFEILPNGHIILLVYPKRLEKGSEILLWDGEKVLSRKAVPDLAEELVRDYRGNPHVVCAKNVYGIFQEKESIEISTLEKEYFKKYLSPILDTNKTKLYFSNFSKDYPSFTYFAYDLLDSTYTKIASITDKLMMELYRSEYKWVDVRTKLWAKNKELETGIDAEIWVGKKYFTQSIYYKELYAPLFHRSDSLFVFDYYRDQLMIFDQKGKQVDSIPIHHHYFPKETGWKKNLIQDRETGQIYAVMQLAGYTYIQHLHTQTGQLGDKIKLYHRYVDKVEIQDNAVFYVYRPFESAQKKFLYKEKLPFNFEKSKVPRGDSFE
jgi:hypothetical protein